MLQSSKTITLFVFLIFCVACNIHLSNTFLADTISSDDDTGIAVSNLHEWTNVDINGQILLTKKVDKNSTSNDDNDVKIMVGPFIDAVFTYVNGR